jgi:hypothetical protein
MISKTVTFTEKRHRTCFNFVYHFCYKQPRQISNSASYVKAEPSSAYFLPNSIRTEVLNIPLSRLWLLKCTPYNLPALKLIAAELLPTTWLHISEVNILKKWNWSAIFNRNSQHKIPLKYVYVSPVVIHGLKERERERDGYGVIQTVSKWQNWIGGFLSLHLITEMGSGPETWYTRHNKYTPDKWQCPTQYSYNGSTIVTPQ